MFVEVIISENNILYDILSGCGDLKLPENFNRFLVHDESTLSGIVKDFGKIDLLIIDKEIKTQALQEIFLITNNTVNLSDLDIEDANYRISKPIRFTELIKKLNDRYSDQSLFASLSLDIIFDEARSQLVYGREIVKLTEKETVLLKVLIVSESNNISKETLLKKYWQYDSETNTSTIETHIFNLKQKMPSGMFENKDGIIVLKKLT